MTPEPPSSQAYCESSVNGLALGLHRAASAGGEEAGGRAPVLPAGRHPRAVSALCAGARGDAGKRLRGALGPRRAGRAAMALRTIYTGARFMRFSVRAGGRARKGGGSAAPADFMMGAVVEFEYAARDGRRALRMPCEGRGRLHAGKSSHGAYAGVDEKWTEAAAATSVMVMVMSAPPRPAVLAAGRPFPFVIRGGEAGKGRGGDTAHGRAADSSGPPWAHGPAALQHGPAALQHGPAALQHGPRPPGPRRRLSAAGSPGPRRNAAAR